MSLLYQSSKVRNLNVIGGNLALVWYIPRELGCWEEVPKIPTLSQHWPPKSWRVWYGLRWAKLLVQFNEKARFSVNHPTFGLFSISTSRMGDVMKSGGLKKKKKTIFQILGNIKWALTLRGGLESCLVLYLTNFYDLK